MNFALCCIGFLGILVFALGLRISLLRSGSGTIIGFKDDPTDTLHKWVRAHGNACEYAPMLAVLIYAVGMRGASGWMEFVAIVAVLSRYLHAAGMILSPSLDQPQPLRFAGALGTYLAGLLLCLSVVGC